MNAVQQPSPGMDTVESVRQQLLDRLEHGQLQSARRRLQGKAILVAAAFVVSYAFVLLGQVQPIAAAVGVVGLMAVAYASISAVMHDANHHAMFENPRLSRLVGYWLDLFGASSMVWCFKHNRVHHDFANVTDTDTDVQQSPFLRLTPHQRWRPWFRFQHLYAPILYGFITVQTYAGDFLNLFSRRVKNQTMDFRPGLVDLTMFGLGKVLFVIWAVVVPVILFGPVALLVAFVASWFVGLALALTVQVAHAVDIVEFHENKDEIPADGFVKFQARVTADVTTRGFRGKVLRWFTGGLDRQLVHHLAPSLPHTLYPQLQQHIEAICAEHGATYRSHPSVRAALRSHFRFLRDLGQKPAF